MERARFDGLLAFKSVAEKKSFTAAAAELGISPSALSQTIKQLEGRLGAALFSRTTRTTHLTEAGERFLAQSGPAMEQMLAAMNEVSAFAKKPAGVLRINALRYAYPWVLAPLVRSFLRKHPEVSVEVFLEDTSSDIVEEGYDAGVRISDILAKDMIAVKLLGPIRFVVAGSPRYFKLRQRPSHPRDLLAHDCIRVRAGQELYDGWEFERGGKPFEVQVSGRLILNDPILVADAAVDGAGLVYAPEDIIQERLKSGELEVVLKDYSAVSAGYYLYFPRRSQAQPKLRAFVDHVKSKDARKA